MYNVHLNAMSILNCPFFDHMKVAETKVDAATAKNAPGVPRGGFRTVLGGQGGLGRAHGTPCKALMYGSALRKKLSLYPFIPLLKTPKIKMIVSHMFSRVGISFVHLKDVVHSRVPIVLCCRFTKVKVYVYLSTANNLFLDPFTPN
jgi:hypothetical protein